MLNPLGTVEADVGASSRQAGSKKASPTKTPTTAKSAPKTPAAEKKAKKRAEAEARNTSHANTRDLRKKQQSAERKWEKAEANVAEIQNQLADPAVYEDNDKVKQLVADLDAAKDAAAQLMTEWEAATLALESAR